MSESAKDPKVEDVLSSVRRLVSGELSRRPRTELPAGPGALVLTDAQRVEQGARARVASKSLEERIAELEVAIGDRSDDDFEPDGSEDQSQHRPDRIVFTRPPATEEEDRLHRATLRLNQIAARETGPAQRSAEGRPAAFRHETRPEAPMAENVAPAARRSAEVSAFSNPDDVVERLDARFERRDPARPSMPTFVRTRRTSEVPPAAAAIPAKEVPAEPVAVPAAGAGDAAEPDDFLAVATSPYAEADAGDGLPERDGADEAEDGLEDAVEEEDPDLAFEHALSAAVAASVQDVVEEVADRVEVEIGRDEATEPVADETPAPAAREAAEAVAESKVDPGDSLWPVAPDETPSTELRIFDESEAASEPTAPETTEEPETGYGADAPPDAAAGTEDAGAEVPAEVPAAIPDAEEMRRLVAQLIREELQGELGERITRNVRKLVRREIMRAMNAKGLE